MCCVVGCSNFEFLGVFDAANTHPGRPFERGCPQTPRPHERMWIVFRSWVRGSKEVSHPISGPFINFTFFLRFSDVTIDVGRWIGRGLAGPQMLGGGGVFKQWPD